MTELAQKLRFTLLFSAILCVFVVVGCTSQSNVDGGDSSDSYGEASDDDSSAKADDDNWADDENGGEKKELTAEQEEATDPTAEDFEPLVDSDEDFEKLSFDETDEKKTASAPTESEGAGAASASTAPTTEETDPFANGTDELAALESTTEKAPTRAKAVFAKKSSVPTIPTDAVSHSGTTLNRFYFIRKGDTPESVAQRIYEDSGRSADLQAWNNKGAWAPGQYILFASPNMPGDLEMKSFYDERGLTPDTVELKRGQSVSQVAKELLGHPNSWKEIAVLNQIQNPDTLSAGTPLTYYGNLDGGTKVASATTGADGGRLNEVNKPSAPEPPTPAPQAALPHEIAKATPPSTPVAPPPAIEAPKPKLPETKKQGMTVGKFLKQNYAIITMGLGLALLGLALLALGRRKKSVASEDFADESFAPPRKKRG